MTTGDERTDARLQSALEQWASVAPLELPSPQDIRARGTGRMRRKRFAAAVTSVAAAAALILGLLTVGGGSAPSRRTTTSTPLIQLAAHVGLLHPARAASQAGQAARAGNALLADTTASLLEVDPGSNGAVAPSALGTVLAQLELGAGGRTASELAHLLGLAPGGSRSLPAEWASLDAALGSDARTGGTSLWQRSALFVARDAVVRPAYLDAVAAGFGDTIWRADFGGDPGAVAAAIDSWSRQVTDAALPPLLARDSLAADTQLVAANALRFESAWASSDRFLPAQTSPAAFSLLDGRQATVEMMHLSSTLPASDSGGITAVELPYRGGRFSALALLPDRSGEDALTALATGLTPSRLSALVAGLRRSGVDLSLPRFSFTTTSSLAPALRAAGAGGLFSATADFSGISSVPLRLDQVAQSMRVSVDERGTDIATATAASTRLVASSRHLVVADLDRPFLFLVRDDATGAVLLSCVVANPADRS